jgi:hypothetical protein
MFTLITKVNYKMEGFRVEDFLGAFLTKLRELRPELADALNTEYSSIDAVKESAFFVETYRPLAMEFIKKDTTIFSVPRVLLRGVDFSVFWSELNSRDADTVWDFLRTALVSSYIGEDWIKTLKTMWSGYTGKSASEIDEVLGDDSTKGNIEELFEFFKETRMFKLGLEMMENIKLEQFGLQELDLTNPVELLNMFKDPSHPFMQRAVGVVGSFVEAKIKNGSLRKEDLIAEVEMLKEKFKHSLGKVFQEDFFGDTGGEKQTAAALMSSHPDARRARMLARLQRKVAKKGK